jgi:hypothetical protein
MPVQIYSQSNPLCPFLTDARRYFGQAPSLAAIRTNNSRLKEFVNNVEQRNFYGDLVDRVEQIAFAFDRLGELAEPVRAVLEAFGSATDEAQARDASSWELSEEIIIRRERLHVEAAILTAYIYHEVATLFFMTGSNQRLLPAPGSELEYLVGVRNKLLVHPEVGAVVKNSRGQLTLGDYLHPHIVGRQSAFMPLVRNYYAQECGAAADFFDEKEALENERLLRDPNKMVSTTKSAKSLTQNQKHHLKAFSVREPDLKQCLVELNQLLVQLVLPDIRAVTQWSL